MGQSIETIIVGGGQAGLATSYHLGGRGCEHIILEQAAQAGNVWRNDRRDSFAFLTPNWSFRLPGAEYKGDKPDGFMPRQEIVASYEQHIERFHLPIHYQQRVASVIQNADGQGYLVKVVLLDRLQHMQDKKISLAPDLKENLAKADKFEADLVKMVDNFIRKDRPGFSQRKLASSNHWLCVGRDLRIRPPISWGHHHHLGNGLHIRLLHR